ncbi:MAG: cyclic nucleotide-binding domain-containing protein [Fibrobacterales bacterium]
MQANARVNLGDSSSPLKTGRRKIVIPKKTFKTDEELFAEGDVGKELFIIQNGEIAISTGRPPEDIELARLGQGAIMGEMALIDRQPRSATATATVPTTVTIINEMTFGLMLKKLPGWLTAVIKIIASRIRNTNKMVDKPLFKKVDKSLGLFLLSKCKEDSEIMKANWMNFDTMKFVDEYCYLTRATKKQFQTAINTLKLKGILMSEDQYNQKMTISDIEELEQFCNT